ncbi:MAG: hypothetical protein JO288_14840 [Hyphomicrobiales bacterium]|nr:hypothetical protein [Hyphomicrobiales bacterium]
MPGKHFTVAFAIAILAAGLPTAANHEPNYSRLAFFGGDPELFQPPALSPDDSPRVASANAGQKSPASRSDSDPSAPSSTRIGQTSLSGANRHVFHRPQLYFASARSHERERLQEMYAVEFRSFAPVARVAAPARATPAAARARPAVKQAGCARCVEIMRQGSTGRTKPFIVAVERNLFRTAGSTHLRRSVVANGRQREAQMLVAFNIPGAL